MRELKDGIRSLVKIDFYGHVHKLFRGTAKEERCANEVKALKTLQERGCKNVPTLLDYSLEECWIKTTNCGSPANNISVPKVKALFLQLEQEFGITHDDPESRNITYNENMGEFCIIDFELATIHEQK
ncbi:serine/threonine protein phosphatase [Akkermansiaceae bacterium]|nr:serine/threonine protein phosphatase [Akkermansiaceae bacterium]